MLKGHLRGSMWLQQQSSLWAGLSQRAAEVVQGERVQRRLTEDFFLVLLLFPFMHKSNRRYNMLGSEFYKCWYTVDNLDTFLLLSYLDAELSWLRPDSSSVLRRWYKTSHLTLKLKVTDHIPELLCVCVWMCLRPAGTVLWCRLRRVSADCWGMLCCCCC